MSFWKILYRNRYHCTNFPWRIKNLFLEIPYFASKIWSFLIDLIYLKLIYLKYKWYIICFRNYLLYFFHNPENIFLYSISNSDIKYDNFFVVTCSKSSPFFNFRGFVVKKLNLIFYYFIIKLLFLLFFPIQSRVPFKWYDYHTCKIRHNFFPNKSMKFKKSMI